MSAPTKKRFGSHTLNQPAAPTPDELMFGPLAAPPVTAASVAAPAKVVAVPAVPAASPTILPPSATAPTGRWVPFGSYVRDQTYLQLKQAEYWEPGFEIRQFLEEAISAALAALPSSQRPLPQEVLDKLLRTNKKLQAGPPDARG